MFLVTVPCRIMTKKVHPNVSFKLAATADDNVSSSRQHLKTSNNQSMLDANDKSTTLNGNDVVALTVWKKSLLLNCKGFTVFDATGNLVFRVDNYVAAHRGEILLMDAHGKPLLTIRRKRLSWGDNWLIYDGESSVNPRFLAQKQGSRLANAKAMTLAHVYATSTRADKGKNCAEKKILYHIEGSYAQRNVVVYDNKRQCVAQVKKKDAPSGVTLGGDVFKLIILRPDDIDSALAMAFIILLEQMFGSS